MKAARSLLALGAVLIASIAATDAGTNDAHLITALPNFDSTVPFNQYAGRLELQTKEKLFYWYTESQNKPKEDPIVLWLSGGPGCSSVGALFKENGPFVVRPDQTVKVNRYSWNRNVNLVWLEEPAGVGFSGPLQDPSYYHDDNVAQRAYEFLDLFFKKYSELQGREFYITGESYAGIYIPFLVDLLVKKPIAGVNLVGYAIGNPVTDDTIDGNAFFDYYWSHGIVSLEDYDKVNESCGSNPGACLFTTDNCTTACTDAIHESLSQKILFAQEDGFNPYSIYSDICLLKNSQASALLHFEKLDLPATGRGDIGVCADGFTELYLRQEKVQKALHVDGGYVEWSDCNPAVGNIYTRSVTSLPKYRNFLSHNLSGLIYSGDADSVINFIGTERWIGKQGLNLSVKNKWSAWFGPDKQLAGYVQDYEGLTFKTVKGAGHMVPAVRPLHGLYMFECFIFGDDKCRTFTYPVDDQEFESGEFEDSDADAVGLGNPDIAQDATSSFSTGSVVVLAVVGLAIVMLVVVRYKNSKKRASYQAIGSRV